MTNRKGYETAEASIRWIISRLRPDVIAPKLTDAVQAIGTALGNSSEEFNLMTIAARLRNPGTPLKLSCRFISLPRHDGHSSNLYRTLSIW
jgi:hypothetical protein